MRAACAPASPRSLKAYGELVGNRKIGLVTADDISGNAAMLLSVFIRDPQFQGQTKEKLGLAEATRLVDNMIKDHFDHWLSSDPGRAKDLLERVIEKRRRAPAQEAGQGTLAQDRDAQAAPARQAHRLHQGRDGRAPRSSWSKATAPAARPSRRATARPRPCCRCAARSSTSPRATSRQARRQPGTGRSHPGPGLRHAATSTATTACATTRSSS